MESSTPAICETRFIDLKEEIEPTGIRRTRMSRTIDKKCDFRIFCLKKVVSCSGKRIVLLGTRNRIIYVHYPTCTVGGVIEGYSYENSIHGLVVGIEYFQTEFNDDILLAMVCAIKIRNSDDLYPAIYKIHNPFSENGYIYKIEIVDYGHRIPVGLKCFTKISYNTLAFTRAYTVHLPQNLRCLVLFNVLKRGVNREDVNEYQKSFPLKTLDGKISVGEKQLKCMHFWKEKKLIAFGCNFAKDPNHPTKRSGSVIFFTTDTNIFIKSSIETSGILYFVKTLSNNIIPEETNREEDHKVITVSKSDNHDGSDIIIWKFSNLEDCSPFFMFPIESTSYQVLPFSDYIIACDKSGFLNLFHCDESKDREDDDEEEDEGEGIIDEYKVTSRKCLKREKIHEEVIYDMEWITEGQMMCTCSKDGKLKFLATDFGMSKYHDERQRIDFVIQHLYFDTDDSNDERRFTIRTGGLGVIVLFSKSFLCNE